LLSIRLGIMFPDAHSYPGCTMSPELVDQTILACCKPQFLKVARVIVDTATALKVPKPLTERLFIDEAPEKPMGTEVDFIADRIKALVTAEKLESQGNLDRWRFSEIRLPGNKISSDVTSERGT
jgi:hypothetical protein